MKLKDVKSRVARANDGAWVDNLPFPGLKGVALKVRAAGCQQANAVMRIHADAAREAGRSLSSEVMNELLLSEAIVLDWNFTDEQGEALPCTPAAVRGILDDPELGEVLRSAITYAALAVDEQGHEQLEVDVKN